MVGNRVVIGKLIHGYHIVDPESAGSDTRMKHNDSAQNQAISKLFAFE